MKLVKLLHNPGAGDEEHSKEKLLALIESKGYQCRYASVKEPGWKDFEPEIEGLVIAGGDGTVRRVALALMSKKRANRRQPIGLLPLGTANNVANALKLGKDLEAIVDSWQQGHILKYDIARIKGLEEKHFFLEGCGFGVFPNLINAMKKRKEEESGSPEEKLATALKLLYDLVGSYEARECRLEIDGADHSGKFLLVEIMNTPSLGPNLSLNPMADPSDGELEIIIIPEDQREKLQAFVQDHIDGKDTPFGFSALKGKDIRITWMGVHVHVDDRIMRLESPISVEVVVKEGALGFLTQEVQPEKS